MIGKKENTTIKVSVYLQECLLVQQMQRIAITSEDTLAPTPAHRSGYSEFLGGFPKLTYRSFPRSLNSKLYIIFFKVTLQHDLYILQILDFSRDQARLQNVLGFSFV